MKVHKTMCKNGNVGGACLTSYKHSQIINEPRREAVNTVYVAMIPVLVAVGTTQQLPWQLQASTVHEPTTLNTRVIHKSAVKKTKKHPHLIYCHPMTHHMPSEW